PHCGRPQLVRLMSAPVFRLKGAGWYETDFKGGKDNQRNLADQPEADAPTVAKDADAADATQPKDVPAEKPADKPVDKPAGAVEKSAAGAVRKPAAGKSAMRGRSASA